MSATGLDRDPGTIICCTLTFAAWRIGIQRDLAPDQRGQRLDVPWP
jgi:hypothetical protein